MMISSLPISFIISLHVFPFDVFVSIGQSDRQLKQCIKKYSFSELIQEVNEVLSLPANCEGKTYTLSSGATILRIVNTPKTPHDFGIITHEIFHAVDSIMRQVGVELSDTSDEVYAYLCGYLTTQIYENISI